MARAAIPKAKPGDQLFETTKLFEDHKAKAKEKALIMLHTVPFEGSVGLVNLLTATRLLRKGFETSVVLYGPGVLIASNTRGFPAVGQEAFPGNLAMDNQLKTFMKEGGSVYACRFAMGALYGKREDDLLEGVKGVHPLDILDILIEHWRAGALVMSTWTV